MSLSLLGILVLLGAATCVAIDLCITDVVSLDCLVDGGLKGSTSTWEVINCDQLVAWLFCHWEFNKVFVAVDIDAGPETNLALFFPSIYMKNKTNKH